MENVQTTEKIQGQQEVDLVLSENIQLAVEIASSFQLFSYRVINPDTFNTRINDLIAFRESNLKSK